MQGVSIPYMAFCTLRDPETGAALGGLEVAGSYDLSEPCERHEAMLLGESWFKAVKLQAQRKLQAQVDRGQRATAKVQIDIANITPMPEALFKPETPASVVRLAETA